MRYSDYNVINASNFTNSQKHGIEILNSENNNFSSNYIINNGNSIFEYGIKLSSGTNNLFYNNYFNNSYSGTYYNIYGATGNHFNTTYSAVKTNILGNAGFGGNFWADYTGTDHGLGIGIRAISGDNIGDDIFPHNPNTNVYDYLPLTTKTTGCVDPIDDMHVGTGSYLSLCNGVYAVEDESPFGIIIVKGNNSKIVGNGTELRETGTGYGFYSVGTAGNLYGNVSLTNCNFNDYSYGMKLEYSDKFIFENVSINESTTYGIYMTNSNNNTFKQCNVTNSGNDGVRVDSWSDDNNYSSGYITGNGDNNWEYGLRIQSSKYNLFYDNYFNNTGRGGGPLYDAYNTLFSNKFNISYDNTTTNILGGSATGGNFWVNYSGIDDGSGAGNQSIAGDYVGDNPLSFQFYTNAAAYDYLPLTTSNRPPQFIFVNQTPPDIDTFNLYPQNLSIIYNITDTLCGVNSSTVKLHYKTNTTNPDCWSWVNGTCLLNDYQIFDYESNVSDNFEWILQDYDVYPYTANILPSVMRTKTHYPLQLDGFREAVKIRVSDVSSSKQYNILGVMVEPHVPGWGTPMTVHYCNSSYSTGNIMWGEDDCTIFKWLPNDVAYNYTKGTTSHVTIPFPISDDGKINDVQVTNVSYFIFHRVIAGDWLIHYITNQTSTSTTQWTSNNGNSWSDRSYSIDFTLFQYDGNDTSLYYSSATDLCGNSNSSAIVSDLIDLVAMPPSAPEIISPANASYSSRDGIIINYTASIPMIPSIISHYNISLYLDNFTYNTSILVNNSDYLNYTWVDASIPDGHYRIGVTAVDNNSLYATGYSENFTIDNNVAPVNLSSRISPLVPALSDDLEGYCNASDVNGDALIYHYAWYLDGVINETGTRSGTHAESTEVNVNNLSSTLTSSGQTWILSCIADDSALNTSWFNSSELSTTDDTLPHLDLEFPSRNAINVNEHGNITFDIIDDSSGVNTSTLIIRVAGISRTSNATITHNSATNYSIVLPNLLTGYPTNYDVTIEVNVSDNSSNALIDSYVFTLGRSELAGGGGGAGAGEDVGMAEQVFWVYASQDGICQYTLGETILNSPSDCEPSIEYYFSCLYNKDKCLNKSMWNRATFCAIILAVLLGLVYLLISNRPIIPTKKKKKDKK